MTREFIFEKATKNMYRYQEEQSKDEVTEPRMCGTIYVEKRALPTKPVRIRVTVEEVVVQPETKFDSIEGLVKP